MSEPPDMSRRSFLRGGVLRNVASSAADRIAGAVPAPSPAAQPEPTRYERCFPILRPPGAVEEEAFLAGCTRCDACIKACPHDSITHAPPRLRRAAGTPMIDPMRQPCWMCEDTPCITACEPGVLRGDLPVNIGVARINPTTCLAYKGSFCTVCSERCPVEGAIELTGGRPRIIEQTCTGCGVCQHVCPAPENAILLMPLPQRPRPPAPPPKDGPT